MILSISVVMIRPRGPFGAEQDNQVTDGDKDLLGITFPNGCLERRKEEEEGISNSFHPITIYQYHLQKFLGEAQSRCVCSWM